MTGIIKLKKADKGFGFIRSDETGVPDIFYHLSALTNCSFEDLQVGSKIRCAIEPGKNGKPRAISVEVLS